MNNLLLKLGLVLISGSLMSCTWDYNTQIWQHGLREVGLKESVTIQRDSGWRLHRQSHIAIATVDRNQSYPRSVARLGMELETQFNDYFTHVVRLDSNNNRQELLRQAREAGCEFIVFVELNRVSDQLSSWTELSEGRHQHPDKEKGPDKVALQVQMYDTTSAFLVERAQLNVESAMFNSVDDSAIDLFDHALADFVSALAGLKAA
ncbi:DUF4823 domain-containing protein [Agaribacterium sp. ZY112]|uniref:DUF4823 domain-containing protein n=1 Tax=Agaribacterium sp. ZY112 TaxID=3233574 RepID=UPI00352341E2